VILWLEKDASPWVRGPSEVGAGMLDATWSHWVLAVVEISSV
jgi:hypothetical protein